MSIISSTKGMIFLETGHPIIQETLEAKLQNKRGEPFDITCSDFDDVRYRLVAHTDTPTTIHFQLAMPYLGDLSAFGASSVIDRIYGQYKDKPDQGYDAGFRIEISNPKESIETIARNFGELKRNVMAAPFERCFSALASGSAGSMKPMVIPFRPLERIVLVPSNDRVLVYFTIAFNEEADRAIARVFLQEFSESQRKVPQAPSVSFTHDCPADLARVSEFDNRGGKSLVGYVQFQVFKSHVEGAKKEKISTLLSGFRSYLHYHIKASKAHLHSRMRHRVDLLLKVLRRADPNSKDESSKKAYRTYAN